MGFAREASPSSTGTQRVSLKDIADELGISQTAVSFAINDRPGVSAETKRRVKEAAANLGGRRSMPRKRWARRKP